MIFRKSPECLAASARTVSLSHPVPCGVNENNKYPSSHPQSGRIACADLTVTALCFSWGSFMKIEQLRTIAKSLGVHPGRLNQMETTWLTGAIPVFNKE
jgi:hypothetical protein